MYFVKFKCNSILLQMWHAINTEIAKKKYIKQLIL